MQLDDFIENVLTQIASGIANANAKLTGSNERTGILPFIMHRGNDSGITTGIAFDVAVTTKSSLSGEGGGKFRLFVVDSSLNGKVSCDKEQISRIRFSVGVDQRLGQPLQTLKINPESDPQ
jgi:hypothetical protein